MTGIIKHRVNIFRLFYGAALLCTFTGCTGHLVYRPEKKITPASPAETLTNSHLPPAPDIKANNGTLAGIDTTGAGIRDDVYIWIFSNYTSTRKNTIITKMAKGIQTVVATSPKTTEDARKLKQSLDDALLMLKTVPGLATNDADKIDRFLYEMTVNTPQRMKSYLQYNLLQEKGK